MKESFLTNSVINEINDELCSKTKECKIHIRLQQRTTKKYITIIEGMSENTELKKIIKLMKKKFVCNGTILKNDDNEKILNLSGDQRHKVKEFLVNYNISKENDVIVHGF